MLITQNDQCELRMFFLIAALTVTMCSTLHHHSEGIRCLDKEENSESSDWNSTQRKRP